MQYPVVVGLGDTDELTVVALCPHHASMIQLLHGRGDAETDDTRDKGSDTGDTQPVSGTIKALTRGGTGVYEV